MRSRSINLINLIHNECVTKYPLMQCKETLFNLKKTNQKLASARVGSLKFTTCVAILLVRFISLPSEKFISDNFSKRFSRSKAFLTNLRYFLASLVLIFYDGTWFHIEGKLRLLITLGRRQSLSEARRGRQSQRSVDRLDRRLVIVVDNTRKTNKLTHKIFLINVKYSGTSYLLQQASTYVTMLISFYIPFCQASILNEVGFYVPNEVASLLRTSYAPSPTSYYVPRLATRPKVGRASLVVEVAPLLRQTESRSPRASRLATLNRRQTSFYVRPKVGLPSMRSTYYDVPSSRSSNEVASLLRQRQSLPRQISTNIEVALLLRQIVDRRRFDVVGKASTSFYVPSRIEGSKSVTSTTTSKALSSIRNEASHNSSRLSQTASSKVLIDYKKNNNKNLLITFSGGQDSITLLVLLFGIQSHRRNLLKLNLLWNHHLWHKDSFFITRHVLKLSFLFKVSSHSAIAITPVKTELQARQWRLKASRRLNNFYKYQDVMQAHSGTDKIETLLLNLFRGTGNISPFHSSDFSFNFSQAQKRKLLFYTRRIKNRASDDVPS